MDIFNEISLKFKVIRMFIIFTNHLRTEKVARAVSLKMDTKPKTSPELL